MNSEILALTCSKCDYVVSGPDHADVKATLVRHTLKRHPAKKAVKK